MPANYPNRFELNGSDYFQVFLDRHHRNHGGVGNISRLAIQLENNSDAAVIESKLNTSELLLYLAALRLHTSSFFKLPVWRKKEGQFPIRIKEYSGRYDAVEDCAEIFSQTIDVRVEPPICFDLVKVINNHVLVVSWSHILLDARGMELLMSSLDRTSDLMIFPDDPELKLPWKIRLMEMRKVKNFLIDKIKPGLQLLHNTKFDNRIKYMVIELSEFETQQLDDRADTMNVGLMKSSYYLGVTQIAFINLVNQVPDRISWVPVPQDQRKKGRRGPVIGNQVSFMFYELAMRNQNLVQVMTDLKNQMVSQMRMNLAKRYNIMMDSMRRFPSWLYRLLVASPTKGALASYFFSDTGDSLKGLKTILGLEVGDVTHFPPNSCYPGLTIIFMRFRGRQKIIYSYPSGAISQERMEQFNDSLKRQLLGDG